ncbi:phage protein, HK97 gp10 family [Clostridiales bacterium oral taxon 876 str. F0540]|nr:phage protein, HK97 gp10 family [Clostridiales bacterium oral taxon 876 str. F0540]
MGYKSYKNEVISKLKDAEKQVLDTIGTFIIAEAQLRTTVDTGNLRRSETFETDIGEKKVTVGVTPEAPYGIYVEKGTSKQKAQPFLEPAVMDNLSKLEQIAGEKISVNMDGE